MVVIWNKRIKEFIGEVVSDKVKNTRTVLVKTVKLHPIYKKRFVVAKKYYVHDESNTSQFWDNVKFRECRPLSKLKRRNLIEIVK